MRDSCPSPLVSVVIPVYNGANYLRQAIDSVLVQTWENTEIIVVDDGSDDDGRTAEIVATYGDRIRYEHKTNGGTASAINRGITLMQGEYFSWLSHDDVYPPDKIERMMKVMLNRAEPAVIFGDYAVIDAQGELVKEIQTGEGFDEQQPLWAVLESHINGCAMLIPRQCFEQCGYMDVKLPATHDYDLWFRIAHDFPFVHLPGVAVFHRHHSLQNSRSPRFLDEVELLWLYMLDRVSKETMLCHAESELAFLQRLQLAPNIRKFPGTKVNLRNRLRAATTSLEVTAVIHRPAPLTNTIQLVETATNAGLDFAGVVSCRSLEEEWHSLNLSRDDGSTLSLIRELISPDSSLVSRLQALLPRVKSELIWVNSGERSVNAKSANLVLAAVQTIQESETAACVFSHSDADTEQHEALALEGALIRTEALRLALSHCNDTPSSLLHSLSRLGAIMLNAGQSRIESSSGTKSPTAKQGVPSAAMRAPQRAFVFINRWPALTRIVTRIVWKLSGGGFRARDRLLRWNGIAGYMDPDWYCRMYPDVAKSPIDPVLHYLMHGYAENRDPSPLFSTRTYLKDHPDVARRYRHALQHYALHGRSEQRLTRPAVTGSSEEAEDNRPAVWIAFQNTDGNVARFARDLAEQISPRLRPMFLCGRGDGTMTLGLSKSDQKKRIFPSLGNHDELCEEANRLNLRRLVILQTAGFDGQLQVFLSRLARPFDVVHLDCDLVPEQLPINHESGRLVSDAGSPPESEWSRDPEHRWLVEQADRQFACSHYLADRLGDYGIQRPIIVAQPPDPHRLRTFRPWAQPVNSNEALRIALFGYLDSHTGGDILISVLEQVKQRDLPLRFIVFGKVAPAIPLALTELVQIVESTQDRLLHHNVCRWRPHLAWFPFQTPAALSYAMTDAQACGLPIAATAMGAVPEQLGERPLSWLMPQDARTQDWTELFLRLHNEGFTTDSTCYETEANLTDDHRLYQCHLYSAVFGD